MTPKPMSAYRNLRWLEAAPDNYVRFEQRQRQWWFSYRHPWLWAAYRFAARVRCALLGHEWQRESSGFFYVEWVGKPCPWCHAAGVSGKSPEGHFFAGCPDPDCLAHNLAYDFVTVDHARAAWDTRALTNTKDMERG